MAEKFDITEALKDNGFEETYDGAEQGYVGYTYTKHYSKTNSNPLQGEWEVTFDVDVKMLFGFGNTYIRAYFSNGKVKDYKSAKRAYNAIRDTVMYNGFEL